MYTVYQRRTDELEDIAWRSQMNPHFLNNCLNSINSMIHQHDGQLAASYLVGLSRLTRKVLENAEAPTITLAEELDMVNQYIHLEQLRFGDHVSMSIVLPPDIDPTKIWVPPLFIQPFVENALIHGLLPKQACGTITIQFLISEGGKLCCSITDDGVGRAVPVKADSNLSISTKSLGIAITRKRIAAFNKAAGRVLSFIIRDLVDFEGKGTGTSVEIQLALVHVE
ncbi:sensor histidine kinase [Parapedobacter tibetensis]|uniref:sensor histidine kinase n=1 Tax=Parapedobacter tibetensis TaxID=2972951 RepID=UPI00214D5059|nr:histidine kinase [Parapedobacter tibetensis]